MAIQTVIVDLNNVAENYEDYSSNVSRLVCDVARQIYDYFALEFHEERFLKQFEKIRLVVGNSPYQHYPGMWQYLAERALDRRLELSEIREIYNIYLTAYREEIGLYDDFMPFLRRARDQQLKIGIISNGNLDRVYHFLDKFQVLEEVDTVVVSGANPFSKPQPETFRIALHNLDSAPLESAFIGDRPDTDIRGANLAGLWSVRLLRGPARNIVPTARVEMADFEIRQLDGIYDTALFGNQNVVSAAVIPCGGSGSRLGHMSEKIQKCMVEVGGKPILAHCCEQLRSLGIRDFHFLVGHRADQIKAYFNSGKHLGIRIWYHDTGAPSTGLALQAALEAVPDRFLYMHGNILCDPCVIGELLKKSVRVPSQSVVALTRKPIARTHPIFTLVNQRISGVKHRAEGPLEPDQCWSLGLAILNKSNLIDRAQDCSSNKPTTEELLVGSLHECGHHLVDDEWYHLETAGDIDRFELFYRRMHIYA